MNDEKIEALLRKTPAVKAPANLRENLEDGIRLPRKAASQFQPSEPRPWLRRWLPALSFAVLFLSCVVVIGVQTKLLDDLKQQNDTLRVSTQNLEQLRADNAEYKKLLAQSQDLDRLRQDSADLDRLRGEVAQLKAQAQQIEQLRADNQKLQQDNASRLAQNANSIGSLDDALEKAKKKAEAISCMNNMKQIGLAFRLWAGDNNDMYPNNFLVMSNELNAPKLLWCPGDTARAAATNWADTGAGNISYRLLFDKPGAYETLPNMAIVQCPIHNNFLLADGSVQMLSSNGLKMLRNEDGKLFLGEPPK